MNVFYDSIIFLYLIASAALAVGLFRERKRQGTWESRHPRAAFTAFLLLCSSAVLVAWGSFIEPRRLVVNRVSIDLPNFEPSRSVRVALISDIQVGDYKKSGWVKKVAQRIQALNPDLVLLAGDIVQRNKDDAQYLSSFQLLASSFSTYAVLGDHDYHVNQQHFKLDQNLADTVHQALTKAGVQVLHNEIRAIQLHGAQFALVGLDDWLAGKTDMKRAIASCHPEQSEGSHIVRQGRGFFVADAPQDDEKCKPMIVLIHNPDFILDSQSKNADLILAGNTHGGQIRLPFIGPVARLPSKLPQSFDEGLFELQYTEDGPPTRRRTVLRISQHPRLFITSGIGESGPRARLFNPPEIALLELR